MSVKLKDLLSSLKEFTATETRGFIDDGFILDLGINATLDTLYREQDDIYNLGIQLYVCSVLSNYTTAPYFSQQAILPGAVWPGGECEWRGDQSALVARV